MQTDLMDAYKRVCGRCWNQREAYERMVMEPAPRYYITPKQAFQVLSPMMRGDFTQVKQMLKLKREMYYSLYDEVVKMAEQTQFVNKSLWFIVQFAVTRPAPRFYITPMRAKNIRGMLKNNMIDSNGKVIDEKMPSYVIMREKRRREAERKRKWKQERMSEGKTVTP